VHNAIGLIPARYQSKRLPGKPLKLLGGVPLVVRVAQAAKASKLLSDIYIATDNDDIASIASKYDINVVMTRAEHKTGTDRIAEAIKKLPKSDIIVNIQGDEPFISGNALDKIVGALDEPDVLMSTLCTPFKDDSQIDSPDNVKVILDNSDFAIYFSRSRIPFLRSNQIAENLVYHHIGVYGYTYEFLKKLTKLDRTPLEITESLEQLRALENGYKIKTIVVEGEFIGIDSEDDLNWAEELINRRDLE